ncbi:hypothetical protein MKW98_030363, partial [Papaver atlanticum]
MILVHLISMPGQMRAAVLLGVLTLPFPWSSNHTASVAIARSDEIKLLRDGEIIATLRSLMVNMLIRRLLQLHMMHAPHVGDELHHSGALKIHLPSTVSSFYRHCCK